MKNPNRNVIVEYKNRRTRKTRNSLWGNLDLKLIAQSVGEDTSLQSAPVMPPESTPIGPDTSILIVNNTIGASELDALAESAPDIKQGLPSGMLDEQQDAPLSPKMAQKLALLTMASPTNARSIVQRRNTNLLVSKRERVAKLSMDQASKDELVTLQIENTKLKQRLVVKLRAENNQMKRMLERLKQS